MKKITLLTLSLLSCSSSEEEQEVIDLNDD